MRQESNLSWLIFDIVIRPINLLQFSQAATGILCPILFLETEDPLDCFETQLTNAASFPQSTPHKFKIRVLEKLDGVVPSAAGV